MRFVGGGEHASVRLDFEFHAAGFEPADGVLGLETVVGADEFAFAAGITAGEFAGIEAGVGDVATSAAGDADFLEEFGAAFEDGDLGLGRGFRAGDGGEESCGTAADNDDAAH